MKQYLTLMFFLACKGIDASAIADVVSNYSKVVVNDNNHQRENSTLMSTIKPPALNETDDDDEIPNYDDFDDISATERSQVTGYDSQTMMKYFNGVVNLLALMYQFGNPPKRSSQKSKSYPRHSGGDALANSVNQLAEDRYAPNTAAKKFRINQNGGYAPLNAVPVFNTPSSGSDTYSTNGKTSYDSDASQYMIKNPESNDSKPDDMFKESNAMGGYSNQDNGVEVIPSYSYEITESPHIMKNDPYHPWKGKTAEEPESKPSPVYYPWMSKIKPADENTQSSWMSIPSKNRYTPEKDEESNDDETPSQSWYMPTKPKYKPPPPMEEDPADDDDIRHIKPSWQINSPPKPSYKAPPMMDEGPDEDEHPEYAPQPMGAPLKQKYKPPQDEPIYFSHPPKKVKAPPPPVEDEPDDDYGMAPPKAVKGKHGPPNDDPHAFDSLLYDHHDGDHGIVYHDFHDEPEHAMKDEDRESKRPYTYYHLGRKLWYVPLLFSLYFIVYIGALVLKSVARHKVQFPEKLWELHDHHHHHGDHGRRGRELSEMTSKIMSSISKAQNKYK